MSGKNYRAYLLSRNKLTTNNLNTYKTKFDSAMGKITPEEATKQLELNDNIIDETQVHNELRDLLRKYVPNVHFLDQTMNGTKLTEQMKYDLLLNFGTHVEPRINAIRNRKLSVEQFITFLVQMSKELAQSGLTQNINENVNSLTNAFRQQINDHSNIVAGENIETLADDLVTANERELADIGITADILDTGNSKQKGEILRYFEIMMQIDRSVYNIDEVVGSKYKSAATVLSDTNIDKMLNSVLGKHRKEVLSDMFKNYFERITNERIYLEMPSNKIQELWKSRMSNNNNQPQPPPPQPIVSQPIVPQPITPPPSIVIPTPPQTPPQPIAQPQPPQMPQPVPQSTPTGPATRSSTKAQTPPPSSSSSSASANAPPLKDYKSWLDKIFNNMRKCTASINFDIEQVKQLIIKETDKYNKFKDEIAKLNAEKKPVSKNKQKNHDNSEELLKSYVNRLDKLETFIDVGFNQINQTYQRLKRELEQEVNNGNPDQSILDAIENKLNIIDGYYNELLTSSNKSIDIEKIDQELPALLAPTVGAVTGTGLRKSKNGSQYEQQLCNGKYYINRKKLSANVLEIRYTKNRHLIPIKSQIVGKALKSIIEVIIDNNNLDKAKYERLTKLEQNLLRSLLPYLGRDIDDVDDDEAFYDRFDVIRGELLSGNDNKMLKREAKQYLLHAVNTGKISRTNFNQMITDLDL